MAKKKIKYPYRFKTREEMIESHGRNWWGCVSWNSGGDMDYLFGIDFPYMEYHPDSSYTIENINGNEGDRYNWAIREGVLIDNKLVSNIKYKKRNFTK